MFEGIEGGCAIMVYRIRYCDGDSPGGSEAVVEAASPTEALVKFCHTLPHSPDPARALSMVTSISAETCPSCEETTQAE